MRGAVLRAAGLDALRVDELPEPQPAAGEVLVRVAAVGINQLDLNVIAGTGPGRAVALPRVLGIDPAGTVAAVGEGVDPALVGTYVVVKPNIPCLRCEACARGRESECPSQQVVGVHRDGGAADAVVVPSSVVFPRGTLDAATASAAVHSVPIALNALETAGVGEGLRVLVLGAGGVLGEVATQLSLHLGATVTTASRRPSPAREGVRALVTGPDADLASAIDADDRFDVVADMSGSARLLGAAMRHLDWAGTAVLVSASVDHELQLDARTFYLRRHRLIGTASADLEQVRRALELVERGIVQVPVAGRFPLERIRDAYDAFQGPRRGKVIIDVDPNS